MALSDELSTASLGKYRLLAELGAGGMATVYLAATRGQTGFTKLLVLKILRNQLAQDPEFLQMFRDEARVAARLNHPNVVQTFEVGEEQGRHLMVMEYLDGQSLGDVLERCKVRGVTLPRALHLRVIYEALAGLHHAHELSDFDGTPLHLVHRDVSPPNVFVTFDGHVKVLDFGIAKAATSKGRTQTGVLKGKLRYMAPEQFEGVADRRADVFAAGVMLWEAATGTTIWKDKGEAEILNRVVNGEIPSPREIDPTVPAALDALCRRAMAHDREARYATCVEVQRDLEKVLDELDGGSAEELGAFVADLFRDARSARNQAVERQLARMDESDSEPRSLVAEPLPTFATTGPSTPRYALQSDIPPPSAKPRPRASRLMVGGLVLAALAAVGLWVSRPKAKPAVVPVVAAAPVESQTISLVVVAVPSNARIYFDDTPLGTNPVIRRVPRDGASHIVRAEAPGYLTRMIDVVSDSDRELNVSLEPSAPAAPSAAVAPAAPSSAVRFGKRGTAAVHPSATAAPDPTPVASAKPPPGPATSRALDKGNPWADDGAEK